LLECRKFWAQLNPSTICSVRLFIKDWYPSFKVNLSIIEDFIQCKLYLFLLEKIFSNLCSFEGEEKKFVGKRKTSTCITRANEKKIFKTTERMFV
jgi:hypothetical protein